MSGSADELVKDELLFKIGERELRLASPSFRAQINVGKLLRKNIVIDESNRNKSIIDLVLEFSEKFLPELVVMVLEDSNPGERLTTDEVLDSKFSIREFLKGFCEVYEVEENFDFLAQMLGKLPAVKKAEKALSTPQS